MSAVPLPAFPARCNLRLVTLLCQAWDGAKAVTMIQPLSELHQSARTARLVWQNRPGAYSFCGGSINQHIQHGHAYQGLSNFKPISGCDLEVILNS